MVSLKSFGITLSHMGGKLKISAMATAVASSKQNLATYWPKSGDIGAKASENGLKNRGLSNIDTETEVGF